MDILKEQDFWLDLLSKVKQAHELMCDVDKAVSTCGHGRGYDIAWHMAEKDDFDALVRAFDAEVTVENDRPFDRYTCYVEDVRVFVLVDHRRHTDD